MSTTCGNANRNREPSSRDRSKQYPSLPPWSPSSWRGLPIQQQPEYTDRHALHAARDQLARLPPLVSISEIQKLRKDLAQVATGRAFLLQGGDCAESFAEFSQDNLLSYYRVMLQMAITLVYGVQRPVVKLGRVAGQFAKPRSSDLETRNGIALPSYRGDMVNGIDFDAAARKPDPTRLIRAYWQSAATLNYLHSLARDGYSALSNVARWNSEYIRDTIHTRPYARVVETISDHIAFVEACGISTTETEQLSRLDFYTSHEALLLDYEEPLTRYDKSSKKHYDCSAHMLWVGNRTRSLDDAHVEFLRGIENPLGIKVGKDLLPHQLLELIERIDPHNTPGRLILISRMGAHTIEDALPPLVEATRRYNKNVIWSCDPMHGNTVVSKSGYKTRRFDDVVSEVRGFFRVHQNLGSYPGGLHLEITGQEVTECLGGTQPVEEERLYDRYHTHCDPRLNASQSQELAFIAAEELRRS